jgi:hypothetical protein
VVVESRWGDWVRYWRSVFLCALALGVGWCGKQGLDHYRKNVEIERACRLLFDEGYYTRTYPDVVASGLEPFEHYKTTGYKKDYNPAPWFNAAFYRSLYMSRYFAHLSVSRGNPLRHYVVTHKVGTTHPAHVQKIVPLKKPRYYVTLCSIFKDEAPYLKEWIEYHKMLGVEHFILFNHNSTDAYQEVLAPYVADGTLRLIDMKEESGGNIGRWNMIQTQSYLRAAKMLATEAEWLILLDTDEFFVPAHAQTIPDVLRDYDAYAAVSFNFVNYGTSRGTYVMPGELLVERLTLRERDNVHVSTVVKPRYVFDITNPHYPILKPGYTQVDARKHVFHGPWTEKSDHSIARFNHYWTRDQGFLERVKIPRRKKSFGGRDARREMEEADKTCSQVEDTGVHRFVPELRRRMGLSVPEGNPPQSEV